MAAKISRRNFLETGAAGTLATAIIPRGSSRQSVEGLNNPVSKGPNFEDYATVEAFCDGVPVYSLGNIAYIYGVSPDVYPEVGTREGNPYPGDAGRLTQSPEVVMQEGNPNPKVKIKPKKSWEIKSNPFVGSMAQPGVRTMWNDNQPLLPIHLIDGDPETAWCSYGCQVPDARPEWIRIDLPRESQVGSVALVCSQRFGLGNCQSVVYTSQYDTKKLQGKVLIDWQGFHRWAGRAFPNELTIQVSRDAWHWETVYENKDFSGNEDGATVIKFEPRFAKQILITGNNFKRYLDKYVGYAFSLGEVEVRDPEGQNLALISRGAGVTASSTSYLMNMDRLTHDLLYGPVQYDLGFKWTAITADEGMHCWQYVEREKGKLEVDPEFDQLVSEMNRNGLKVILSLDPKGNPIYKGRKLDWRQARIREISNTYYDSPGWAWESDEMWKAYLRYTEFIVKHFKGRVSLYGFGADWPYRLDIYLAVVDIVKKIDPDVPRGGGQQPGSGPQTWKLDAGDVLDLSSWTRMDAGMGAGELPAYFTQARERIKELRANGFKGIISIGNLYWSLYPPGPNVQGQPSWTSVKDPEHGFTDYYYWGDSEIGKAKTLAQSMVGYAGLGAGLCALTNPYFTSPLGQSLFRTPVPAQTVIPTQPEPAYYTMRTLCTVFDEWTAAEFPVTFGGGKEFQTFTFRRGNDEFMVAAWIPGYPSDGITEAKSDVTLTGIEAKEAWVVDVLNGTEQKLITTSEAAGTVFKGVLIKDYPTLMRVMR